MAEVRICRITIPVQYLYHEVGQKLLIMATKEVFCELIDRGLKQNLINRDGDLDQGMLLTQMYTTSPYKRPP
jgi:hypothetical protein